MSQIDWQAYLDDSLSPEQKAEAERALLDDEGARKQLAGLKSFITEVRGAALAEQVPLDRLTAMIPRQRSSRFSWRLPVATLAAAAAIATLIWLRLGPGPAKPDGDAIFTSDVVVATSWVQSKMPFKVPQMDLGSKMPLIRVHHGADSCCFDYQVDGRLYHVNVLKKGALKREGKQVTLANGLTAYISRGVRWSQGDLSFYVVGPNRETSLEVASAASARLAVRT